MALRRSRDNPVTETDAKAQGGQKDRSVATDQPALALVHGAGDSSEIPAGSL
jgi:hypothetical protein